jgi:hypothetical protein
VRDRPGLISLGLLGFLARGGAVLFVLPIVVLPTPTGLSNFIGSQALTAGGPSLGLIWLLATALTGVAALILFGTVIGAVVDLRLLGEAVEFEAARDGGLLPGVRGTVTCRRTSVHPSGASSSRSPNTDSRETLVCPNAELRRMAASVVCH